MRKTKALSLLHLLEQELIPIYFNSLIHFLFYFCVPISEQSNLSGFQTLTDLAML